MTSPTLPVYAPVGVCLLVCCIIMVGVWLWAKPKQNTGVVNIFWAFNFSVIALVLYALAPGWLPRKSLLCTMVLIAGLRLGTRLGLHALSQLEGKEGRFKQLRKTWGLHANQKFLFFQAQALSNIVL